MNYPVFFPPIDILDRIANKSADVAEVDFQRYNFIILSQSCDLEKDKIDMVLISPIVPLYTFIEKNKQSFPTNVLSETQRKNMVKALDRLVAGHFIGACILHECDLSELYSYPLVVEFERVQSTPLKFLSGFVERSEGKRIQLQPPYRELLSQSFARFLMRVGLPEGIDTNRITDRMHAENWSLK